MSETIKWSFSTDRCVRRCERQYFLQHVAAWHNARDSVRREAYLSKQVKTLDLWQGNLVHRGIELFVVPAFGQAHAVDWDLAIEKTVEIAGRQFAFSAAKRYREPGLSKGEAGDDYCALVGHELGEGISDAEYQTVLKNVEKSFRNLSEMDDVLRAVTGRGKYWPELKVNVTYDLARIEARLDLLFFRGYGKPTIVDWKVSESLGGGETDVQTALYAWALCRHPAWRVTKPEDCELMEVQLLTKSLIRHHATQETFEDLENRIYRSVRMIRALRGGRKYDLGDLEDYDFAANPNSCSICAQRKLCQELLSDDLPIVELQKPKRKRQKDEERSHASACPQLF